MKAREHHDPLREVRRTKLRVSASCDHDVEKLGAELMEFQKQFDAAAPSPAAEKKSGQSTASCEW